MIEIEKGVPVPTQPINNVYSFGAMEIGDSFILDQAQTDRVRPAASVYKRRHPGWDYTSRTQPDGSVRIWRTA